MSRKVAIEKNISNCYPTETDSSIMSVIYVLFFMYMVVGFVLMFLFYLTFNFFVMFKPSKMEYNPTPSALNTSTGKSGVLSQLSSVLGQGIKPEFNGATIESMRGNPMFDRGDAIDKVGKAQKALAEQAATVSKSKFVRQLNSAMKRDRKPSVNR